MIFLYISKEVHIRNLKDILNNIKIHFDIFHLSFFYLSFHLYFVPEFFYFFLILFYSC